MTNTDTAPAVVSVPVQSALLSKTNILLTVGAIADVLNEASPLVPPKYQHWVTLGISLCALIGGVITRTWFSTTITPSSAAKL